MRWSIGLSFALLVSASAVCAQGAPPSTDIYLVRLRGGAIGDPPVNLTHRAGYDNQPAFTPDGRSLLYTAILDDGQADIFRIDLASRRPVQLTHTPESEYSPTPLPTGGGFSVVRVERDSAQRLWAFDASGQAPRLLLPNIAPVGYQLWLDDHTLALFVLGSPDALEIADVRADRRRAIARDVGRSLQRVPGSSRFSFLQHTDSTWQLETADPAAADGAVRRVAAMPAHADYVVWESPTRVLTAAGTRVYRLDLAAGADARWKLVADFREEGIRNLSRLALSPDGQWLALVAETP